MPSTRKSKNTRSTRIASPQYRATPTCRGPVSLTADHPRSQPARKRRVQVAQLSLNYACPLIFRPPSPSSKPPSLYPHHLYRQPIRALLSHVISGTSVLDGFVECELSAQQRPLERWVPVHTSIYLRQSIHPSWPLPIHSIRQGQASSMVSVHWQEGRLLNRLGLTSHKYPRQCT